MNDNRRGGLATGLMLIFIGLILVAFQFEPFKNLFTGAERWPLTIIFLGVIFILVSLVTRASGMAVPGTIIGGIGGILYYNANFGNYSEWSYMWTLIPGFVGVGVFLSHLFDLKPLKGIREGLPSILISGVMFGVFGSMFNPDMQLLQYWPYLLIVLGVWMLLNNIIGGFQDKRKEKERIRRREERKVQRTVEERESVVEVSSEPAPEPVPAPPTPEAPSVEPVEIFEEEFPSVPEELPNSDTEKNPFEEDGDEELPNPH